MKRKNSSTSNSIYQLRRSFHASSLISANKDLHLIKPLKTSKNINKKLIATIDLETIELKNTQIVFKDSLRVFPVSLQELTKVFEVEGKLYSYNPEFNKISLFEDINLLNQFVEYSKQDSICLLKALTKAQDIYIEEHKVDIATI